MTSLANQTHSDKNKSGANKNNQRAAAGKTGTPKASLADKPESSEKKDQKLDKRLVIVKGLVESQPTTVL